MYSECVRNGERYAGSGWRAERSGYIAVKIARAPNAREHGQARESATPHSHPWRGQAIRTATTARMVHSQETPLPVVKSVPEPMQRSAAAAAATNAPAWCGRSHRSRRRSSRATGSLNRAEAHEARPPRTGREIRRRHRQHGHHLVDGQPMEVRPSRAPRAVGKEGRTDRAMFQLRSTSRRSSAAVFKCDHAQNQEDQRGGQGDVQAEKRAAYQMGNAAKIAAPPVTSQ